ncbi:MAG: hypothetical protein LAO03_16645 [Acidobacteriia bacterium]|nr:hypothetical protein [Terriglobia bacterium]
MQRLLSLFLVAGLILASSSCGNVEINGAINPGTSTITGFVSVVHLTSVIGGDGVTVLVTFVTFLAEGSSTTVGFCGDQTMQFPLNQMVQANFTPGQTCAAIIVIIIK